MLDMITNLIFLTKRWLKQLQQSGTRSTFCCRVWLLIIIGTLGYALVEGWPRLDAYYATIITVIRLDS